MHAAHTNINYPVCVHTAVEYVCGFINKKCFNHVLMITKFKNALISQINFLELVINILWHTI
jgi:hypothetical protein